MAGLADILGGALGGDALSQIAGRLGTDSAGAQSAVKAALPALLGRLKSNAETPEGAAALAAAVNKDHDGSILDNLGSLYGEGDTVGVGGKILGKVFGADQGAAEDQVSQLAGIGKSEAGGLLAMLAPMVLGALGKSGQGGGGVQASGLSSILGGLLGGGGGGLSDMLGGLLGGGKSTATSAASSATSAASSATNVASAATGGAGSAMSGAMGKVTGMLDQNKDGNVMDDVQRMAKGGILQKLMAMFKRK